MHKTPYHRKFMSTKLGVQVIPTETRYSVPDDLDQEDQTYDRVADFVVRLDLD